MSKILVGYARVSTEAQDLTAQRDALAACRAGDTFVVTKLDRLVCSVRDGHEISDDLAKREIKLSIGGSIHDPTDPMGKLLFNVLAMISEFETDLIRMRTREGMTVAKAKGRLRGKNQSSPPSRNSFSWNYLPLGSTATQSWPSCLTSVAPPSTGQLNAGSCGISSNGHPGNSEQSTPDKSEA